mgnify:CR=1 FL=1
MNTKYSLHLVLSAFELLKKSINLVTSQVDKIFIVDNASSNTSEIRKAFNDSVSIKYLAENVGLSKAYNIGIDSSINDSFEFIIFLDQDSLLQPNAIDNLLLGFAYSDSVSAVVPSIKDANSGHLTTVLSDFEIAKIAKSYSGEELVENLIVGNFLLGRTF